MSALSGRIVASRTASFLSCSKCSTMLLPLQAKLYPHLLKAVKTICVFIIYVCSVRALVTCVLCVVRLNVVNYRINSSKPLGAKRQTSRSQRRRLAAKHIDTVVTNMQHTMLVPQTPMITLMICGSLRNLIKKLPYFQKTMLLMRSSDQRLGESFVNEQVFSFT